MFMSWDAKVVPRAMSLEEQRTSMLNKYRFGQCYINTHVTIYVVLSSDSID